MDFGLDCCCCVVEYPFSFCYLISSGPSLTTLDTSFPRGRCNTEFCMSRVSRYTLENNLDFHHIGVDFVFSVFSLSCINTRIRPCVK